MKLKFCAILLVFIIGLQASLLYGSNKKVCEEPFDGIKESKTLFSWSTHDGQGDEDEYLQEFKQMRCRVCLHQKKLIADHGGLGDEGESFQEVFKKIGKSEKNLTIKSAQDEPEFCFADKPETPSQEKQTQSADWCTVS